MCFVLEETPTSIVEEATTSMTVAQSDEPKAVIRAIFCFLYIHLLNIEKTVRLPHFIYIKN